MAAQSPRRAAYVSVTDKSGNAVLDVGPSEFVVREDKVAREVLEVSLADEPLQIALLIDNSQAAESFIRDYREALSGFIAAVTADNPSPAKGKHQIALITLASRPTVLHDYSSDEALLLKSARSVFAMPQTGTYLLDGIIETSQGIVKRSAARPVFVAVVTEGPELSDRPFDVVLRALRDSGAALHVIKVGRPANNSHDRAMAIDQGTQRSGGRNEELFASSALTAKMKQIAVELTRQYRVTYARPQSLVPPETLAVTVSRRGLTARGTAAREDRPQVRP